MPDGAAAIGAAAAGVPPQAGSVLDAVCARAADQLRPLAARIDRDGFYPEAVLRGLGEDGAFGLHLATHTRLPTRSVGAAIGAMAAVGAECMATAFCMWCQDACGWYLENSDNVALRARLQPAIATGATLGGTGLSNPMKALSGIEDFRLRAEPAEGGYVVSGILPWVSNLGRGHWFGTIFARADDPAARVMAMVECGQPGVEIRQNARFVALEGTGTYSVLFRRAFIPEANLLADPLGDMARRIKPGFILLQAGMGLGVVAGCIALMRDADRTQARSNQYLPRGAAWFEDALGASRAEIMQLAETPRQDGSEYLRGVLEARLRLSELALEAAQAVLLHGGARFYIEGSPAHRRLRESWFVAIITPSIRHLRQELAGMSAN